MDRNGGEVKGRAVMRKALSGKGVGIIVEVSLFLFLYMVVLIFVSSRCGARTARCDGSDLWRRNSFTRGKHLDNLSAGFAN